MKQEQNNTFTEGLVQDLNPINTPNTVLTDNLNGTIITYDGNEFSLQNDRGNYPLQYCKLKPNYIPVGVKEYADTLYIVSYNPLDNKTEIGSYPSPLEVSSSNDGGDIINIPSLIEQSEKYPNYTKLVEQTQMQVFSDDELKLYPGDEYQIKLFDESKYIYEELEYYIIDENRNKYNITDKIKENSDFSPIGWSIPGWIAAQYRLAVFDDFQMNARSFVIPTLASNSDGHLTLNFQLKISDKLFLNRFNSNGTSYENLDEIGLSIKIVKNEKTLLYFEECLFENLDGKFSEWYEESKILWSQKQFDISYLNQGDVISVEAIPFIQVNVNKKYYKVVYDNFKETLDISIANIGSYSDFQLANNTWKFWSEEDDENNLYLEFDISGPIITSNNINLYYKITELPDKYSIDRKQTDYINLESYNGVGQNMVLIPYNDVLKREGMYIIEFVFSEKDPNISNIEDINKASFKKMIISSQIFSDFVKDVDNFETLTFDDWSEKYKNSVKNYNKWSVVLDTSNEQLEPFKKGDILNNKVTGIDIPDFLKRFWTIDTKGNKYNHTAFVTSEDWEKIKDVKTEFIRGYKTKANVKLNTEMDVLQGMLWDGMSRIINIELSSHGEHLVSNSYYANNISKSFDLNINPIVSSSCYVSYEKQSEGLVRGSKSESNIYELISNEVKYGIVVGSNIKRGTNNITMTFFSGFEKLPMHGIEIPNTVKEINEIGDKKKIPNSLTGEITKFLSKNNQFAVIFVVARQINDKKNVAVYSGDNQLYETNDKDIWMQPFVVFLNKQNEPVFFPIEGWDKRCFYDANTEINNRHDVPFEEYGIGEFTRHMYSMLGDFVKYQINDIKDGFFIKCIPSDESDINLNLSIKINIPEITSWIVNNYNLLDSSDRAVLKTDLYDVSFGNLLTGSTTKLNTIDVDGIEYNKTIDNSNATIKQELEKIRKKIYNVAELITTQWENWRHDDLFNDAVRSNSLFGINMISNNNSSNIETFKQSDLYKLIKTSITNESNLTISASGEKLWYTTDGMGNPYCIGYIHPSITFP